MSTNLIHYTLRRRSNPQHRRTSGRDLRPAGIPHDLCTYTHTDRLRLQHLELILALDLYGDLCLSETFPVFDNDRGGKCEGLVAGERCVRTLCCYLTLRAVS